MLCNCIICGETKEASEEHVIPDAIGGKIKIKNVCKCCNEKLGSYVDFSLTDCDFSLFARQFTNAKNRDNIGVNIFTTKYGWYNEQNIKVKLKQGEIFGKDLLYDGSQNPEVSLKMDKVFNRVSVSYSGSDYESIIKKIARKLKSEGISVSEEEAKRAIPIDSMKIAQASTRIKHDLIITWDDYFPCVFKIAYEICCVKLGNEYINDDVGKRLKNYLYNKSYQLQCVMPRDLIDRAGCHGQIANHHTIRISRSGNNVIVRIHLFGYIFFKIITSNSADRYADILDNDIKISSVF